MSKSFGCVSDEFEVKIIVKKILECAKNNKPECLELNTLINEFNKEIDGKRYLLVLDEVWNEDPHKWFELNKLLMVGARGSRILVTTRIYIYIYIKAEASRRCCHVRKNGPLQC